MERGRVTIAGRRASLGDRVGPGEEVRVDGRVIEAPPAPRTFALNKPAGVVTSAADERGRTTVFDLVPQVPGLHSVGRLDRDSEGLLLLTTDGELTLRLTHPRYEHPKTYRVWCRGGTLSERALGMLREGIELDDGPARAQAARPAPGGAVVVLGEGRKRQLRRMCAAVGARVERLLRTQVGALPLGELASGEWRELSREEVDALRYDPARGRRPGRRGRGSARGRSRSGPGPQ